MDILDKIKAECDRHIHCSKRCPLYGEEGCIVNPTSSGLDIDGIRKAIGEPVGNCSTTCPTTEIVVPEKWEETDFHWQNGKTDGIMRKQHEIIECLEKIKERSDGKDV